MSELIPLPETLPKFLQEYLPAPEGNFHVTLTYATSIDSRIAALPGTQTAISHLETKTMTHYIRYQHDSILIGSGTALADDPGLNCRYKSSMNDKIHMIRPVIVDPSFKWNPIGSRVMKTCKEGKGLAPFVIVNDTAVLDPNRVRELQSEGGQLITIKAGKEGRLEWESIFQTLRNHGLKSIMVEGGANVINELLLYPDLVNSLIVTIGPIYLGKDGVQVSPKGQVGLVDIKWWTGVQDSVLCGRLRSS